MALSFTRKPANYATHEDVLAIQEMLYQEGFDVHRHGERVHGIYQNDETIIADRMGVEIRLVFDGEARNKRILHQLFGAYRPDHIDLTEVSDDIESECLLDVLAGC